MIAKLKGLVDALGEDWVVIDVQGVGYLVFCASRTLSRLPAVGQAAVLHIETHVREDHIHLYGFLSEAERALFRLLTTVQGVGAKVALSILSLDSPDRLAQALAAQDKTLFTRASGVGPKLAARLVTELKDKAVSLGAISGLSMPSSPNVAITGVASTGMGTLAEDAVSALVNLGYARVEAFAAVSRMLQAAGEELPALQKLIGLALKDLGREAGA